MEVKIEKISELSKLLSVKTRMSDDLFHLFGKFGIGHLLSRLSLEKQNGVSTSQATCSLVDSSTYHVTLSLIQSTRSPVYSFTRPLTMLLCLFLQATCLLVHLSTRQLTLLLCLFHKQLVNSSTRSLVY